MGKKKGYESPKIALTLFEKVDVITASETTEIEEDGAIKVEGFTREWF